jgi:hypothetical protein
MLHPARPSARRPSQHPLRLCLRGFSVRCTRNRRRRLCVLHQRPTTHDARVVEDQPRTSCARSAGSPGNCRRYAQIRRYVEWPREGSQAVPSSCPWRTLHPRDPFSSRTDYFCNRRVSGRVRKRDPGTVWWRARVWRRQQSGQSRVEPWGTPRTPSRSPPSRRPASYCRSSMRSQRWPPAPPRSASRYALLVHAPFKTLRDCGRLAQPHRASRCGRLATHLS